MNSSRIFSWGSHPMRDPWVALFYHEALERGHVHLRQKVLTGKSSTLFELADGHPVVLDDRDAGKVIWSGQGCLIMLGANSSLIKITVASNDRALCERTLEDLETQISAGLVPVTEDRVAVHFRAKDRRWVRRIECPTWVDISRNYVPRTREQLHEIMDWPTLAARPGRLIVLHGPPGTGKTTAIRALCREWAPHTVPGYLTDPEVFFRDAGYVSDVLMDEMGSFEDRIKIEERTKPALLIAEDCDEYLHADARVRSSAALGRLLNLTDGIVGDGTNVTIVVTTNEPLSQLHPALARSGRALAVIEFEKFTSEQAREWGSALDSPNASVTLAELFHGAAKSTQKAPVGFVNYERLRA